jgi:hypothetical protein
MYRVTTPTHTFTLPFDTSGIDELKLTYRQKDRTLEFNENDVEFDGNKIIKELTQEDTKMFRNSSLVHIQARIKMTDGKVIASNILSVRVEDVLNDEVM